ncbi:MAG TPA: hypothetical protein VNL77_12900 [Roseiflexaceae bacterium]|nr:hypothetical protein [Roseiflexaceae bacterium]
MTTIDQRPAQPASARDPSLSSGAPKLSGDELFVPASHVLVIDRQVSHPAFRLWCVLHRLWFLHEPPVMELLQELMGTTITDKATQVETWQPATRRSIERWLTELEQAGWLIWARRGETTRRYHLRTSARSATDTAVLTELRTLLNSGKATLAEVQALLNLTPQLPADATAESHGSIPGSHQDAEQIEAPAADATPGSHEAGDDTTAESDGATIGSLLPAGQAANTTVESHDPILASHDATGESQDATLGSHGATAVSHDATPRSHGELAEGVLMDQNQVPYSEILQNEIYEDPTPPPGATGAQTGGDGGGLTATERYLLREGFSTRAAREFRDLDRSTVQADLERRRGLGQGIGAIVTTWRVEPPHAATPDPAASPAITRRATSAKAQALAIAPPEASPLEIQYLALDLEEGAPTERALANLQARRAATLAGGVA